MQLIAGCPATNQTVTLYPNMPLFRLAVRMMDAKKALARIHMASQNTLRPSRELCELELPYACQWKRMGRHAENSLPKLMHTSKRNQRKGSELVRFEQVMIAACQRTS